MDVVFRITVKEKPIVCPPDFDLNLKSTFHIVYKKMMSGGGRGEKAEKGIFNMFIEKTKKPILSILFGFFHIFYKLIKFF